MTTRRHSSKTERAPLASNRAADNHSVAWLDMVDKLTGIGEHLLQPEGSRIYLPTAFTHRVAQYARKPWLASCWLHDCLRIVPHHLWQEYLNHVPQEFPNPISSSLLHTIFAQPAAELVLDKSGRWTIPAELVAKARLTQEGKTEIVLLPNQVWIEIWNKTRRQQLFAKAIEQAQQLLSPTFFQNAPKVAMQFQ